MKYIITEEQNYKLYLLRRLDRIDHLVEYRMDEVYEGVSIRSEICGDSPEDMVKNISEWVATQMYYNHFSSLGYDTEIWDMIIDYIETKHGDRITKLYNKICLEK